MATINSSISGEWVTVVTWKKERLFHPVGKSDHISWSLKNSLLKQMMWKRLGSPLVKFIMRYKKSTPGLPPCRQIGGCLWRIAIQLVEWYLVCCQVLFTSFVFSSSMTSVKLPLTQSLKIVWCQSCSLYKLPAVDMDAGPVSTFVNHCSKFVMFLDHLLCLLFYFIVCFISRNKCMASWGASCFGIASRLIFCRVFPRDKIANSVLIYLYSFVVS